MDIILRIISNNKITYYGCIKDPLLRNDFFARMFKYKSDEIDSCGYHIYNMEIDFDKDILKKCIQYYYGSPVTFSSFEDLIALTYLSFPQNVRELCITNIVDRINNIDNITEMKSIVIKYLYNDHIEMKYKRALFSLHKKLLLLDEEEYDVYPYKHIFHHYNLTTEDSIIMSSEQKYYFDGSGFIELKKILSSDNSNIKYIGFVLLFKRKNVESYLKKSFSIYTNFSRSIEIECILHDGVNKPIVLKLKNNKNKIIPLYVAPDKKIRLYFGNSALSFYKERKNICKTKYFQIVIKNAKK